MSGRGGNGTSRTQSRATSQGGTQPVANSGIEVIVTATPLTIGGSQSGYPEIDTTNINDAQGRRVRLRPKNPAAAQTLGDGLMTPLAATGGMVFPYQPTINYQQDVTYTPMELVHANQDFLSYTRTPALRLSVDGQFTVQNQREGAYALACIHFLRTVTKMYFGGAPGSNAERYQGTPPPVLLFDAYGQFMFNALPVVVTQFAVTLPNDVDYVPVEVGQGENYVSAGVPEQFATWSRLNQPNLRGGPDTGYAWLPSMFNISVQITVQNTPRRLRQFDLDRFRNGELLRSGGWV